MPSDSLTHPKLSYFLRREIRLRRHILRWNRPLGLVWLILAASSGLVGQQTSPPPDAPQAQPQSSPTPRPDSEKKAETREKRHEEQTGTSNDRLFYALPNFLTVQTGQLAPLTTGQKFKVVARGSFDYIQIPWYGFLSGISQAEDSEEGYGQGAEGYGKRFAAYFADGTIENFMTGAVLPSILKQDPRFYQSGKGSFKRRTLYAVSRIFVTPTDSGKTAFNYSEIGGSAASSFISSY